ncbi:MAG: hypothetical protein L0229_27480 [Blastocatellia bacterium]|nr:hypothetical protein [Blastocatellia bacterium]
MRKHFARTMVGLMSCCLLLALAAPGLADYQGRTRGRAYTKADVDRIIKRAEDRSDNFVKLFDKNLDRSALDGTKREDRLNDRAKDLEKALDKLRKEFDRRDSWRETRSEVENVLEEAVGINRVMLNSRLNRNVEASWALLRGDLNTLAGVYNLPKLKTRG